jgi:hypothetical protein
MAFFFKVSDLFDYEGTSSHFSVFDKYWILTSKGQILEINEIKKKRASKGFQSG